MKELIIRSNELPEKDYDHTKVVDLLNNEKYPFSVAKVRKVGDDIKMGYDSESDVAYYVLEGEGKCVIEKKEYLLKKGDLVFLSKGTKYKNLKGLTLLAIASPRFKRNKRMYVK